VAWGLLGCAPDASRSGGDIGSTRAEFVNGADDRREYFELTDPAERATFEESLVALVPSPAARELALGNTAALTTWGDVNDLCDGEPFADQPSASFCSGVLVDWDLVLTSGHCVSVVPLTNLRIVFDYYYREPGELAVSEDDIYQVEEVVAARIDRDPNAARLDFGWLRLSEPVREPHRPARLQTGDPAAALGEAIISISAGGGAPLKLDAGGQVLDVRADTNDYFIADTDTSEGSSGGPAFDENLTLLGTLARGAPDFVRTDAGCWTTDHGSTPLQAREQFTYAYRSLQALCERDSSSWLCDPSCSESPCEPPPRPRAVAAVDEGCALGRVPKAPGAPALGLALGSLLALSYRRTRGSQRPRA
jgi:hypothetical protein